MFNLFTKFPVIYYNDNPAVNLLAKVKFNNAAKKAGAIYYPYTILEGERPDVIAANYYDDPRYSWLIYMANDIIDPIHDWPLTEREFNQLIVKKYGSIETAIERIEYWRVNWYEDETMLSIAGYEALPSYAKKYFAPKVTAAQRVVAYERARLDTAVETNKIQTLNVSSTAAFSVGENITQKTSGSTTGTATIKMINGSSLVIHHVVGEFTATGGNVGNVIGVNTQATAAITAVATLSTPIPANEAVYWTYVSAYDYETEQNEQKRHIQLIDKSYVDQIEKELDELL